MYDQFGNKIKLTKQLAISYLQFYLTGSYQGCSEVVMVEDSAKTTKHVCYGFLGVKTLQRGIYQLNDEGTLISISHWYCPQCSKLIVNKDFM